MENIHCKTNTKKICKVIYTKLPLLFSIFYSYGSFLILSLKVYYFSSLAIVLIITRQILLIFTIFVFIFFWRVHSKQKKIYFRPPHFFQPVYFSVKILPYLPQH